MAVRNKRVLVAPNMERRSVAYPRRGFKVITGFPKAKGSLPKPPTP